MKKIVQFYLTLSLSIFLLSFTITAASASKMEYQDNASAIIANSIKGENRKSFLKEFYRGVLFLPVWMGETYLTPHATALFSYVRKDKTLNPQGKLYTDASVLEQEAKDIYAIPSTLTDKIAMEFRISQFYKSYTDYAYLGSINWGAFNARISNLMVNGVSTEWMLHRSEMNPVTMVENALLGSSLAKELNASVPTAYHYKALQKELMHYMKLKDDGGWNRVLLSDTLKPGKSRKGVPSLRERLRVTKDYISCSDSEENNVYDVCLQEAVKRFQLRNGLNDDAVVGAGTRAVLNVSVDQRIETIRLNLDRIKWLSDRKSKRHIIINIPAFQLYFEDDDTLVQTMRTVTGSPKHPTPIFSDMVEYIVLNPYWNIPKSIIQKEMIPKLMRNSNAMARQGIEIHSGWGKNAKKISGGSVNWAKYRYSKSVPFHFAQVPGYKNALGKVKFLFPNKFSVYMHDTPSKHLFKKEKRAFSHGCIRLQKPRELLRTFSEYNTNIDFDKSQKILEGKKRTYMSLQEKVPVDVVYLTAWVDYEGKIQFRNDVYGYDAMQMKSFREW